MVFSLSWVGIQKLQSQSSIQTDSSVLNERKVRVRARDNLLSDIGVASIDYCKEESRLVFTIRKVFVLPTFILELVLVVRLSTE